MIPDIHQKIETKDLYERELSALYKYLENLGVIRQPFSMRIPERTTIIFNLSRFNSSGTRYYYFTDSDGIDSKKAAEYKPTFDLEVTTLVAVPAKPKVIRIWIDIKSITSEDLILIEDLLFGSTFGCVKKPGITFLDYKNIWINEKNKVWGYTDEGPKDCDQIINIDSLGKSYSNSTVQLEEKHISPLLKALWGIFWN